MYCVVQKPPQILPTTKINYIKNAEKIFHKIAKIKSRKLIDSQLIF